MKRIATTWKYGLLGILFTLTFLPAVLELVFNITTGMTDTQLWLWTIAGLIITALWYLGVQVKKPYCEND